jgi:hypothetical protein
LEEKVRQLTSNLQEEKEKVRQLTSNLQRVLECPVCFNLMDATLTHCVNGHGICKSCSSKIEICPTCKQELSKVCQNTLLGQVLELLPRPCPYTDAGCSLAVFDQVHETYCEFRSTECRVTDCTWKGCVKDLVDHLRNSHKFNNRDITFNINVTSYRRFTLQTQTPSSVMPIIQPIICDGNIFWYYMHRNNQKKCIFHELFIVPMSKPVSEYFMVFTFKTGNIEFTHTCKAMTDIEDNNDDKSFISTAISFSDLEYFKSPGEKNEYTLTCKMVKNDMP